MAMDQEIVMPSMITKVAEEVVFQTRDKEVKQRIRENVEKRTKVDEYQEILTVCLLRGK